MKSVLIHLCFWLGLAVAAYATAGSYTWASCWQILPMYLILSLWFDLALLVFFIFLVAAMFWVWRLGKYYERIFWIHLSIVAAGPFACSFAAFLSAGQVSCL